MLLLIPVLVVPSEQVMSNCAWYLNPNLFFFVVCVALDLHEAHKPGGRWFESTPRYQMISMGYVIGVILFFLSPPISRPLFPIPLLKKVLVDEKMKQYQQLLLSYEILVDF